MSEGMLNGHLSTTSLSVVWTTKEVEDKNNQHHHYSRRRQFFTASFSAVSPFLTPSSHQLYLWSGYTPLEDCLRDLVGKEIVFRCRDGSEFRAFYAKDRKEQPASSRGNLMDKVKELLFARYGGNVTDDFDVKRVGDIDVEELKDKTNFWVKDQYKKKVNLNSKEPTFLAEAFVKSRFDHTNIITPDAFVLADPVVNETTGSMYRSLFRFTPFEGVGNLKKFDDFLSGASAELREVILSQIIKGALKGLEHIHLKGFVHGNFVPSNIIVCEDQDPKSLTGLTGKLIGFSRSWKTARSKLGTSTHERRELKHAIDPSVDRWALGSCLYFLCTEPFQDSSPSNSQLLWTDVIDGKGLGTVNDGRRWMKNTSNSLKCLINYLLDINPNKRFECGDVLNSAWMQRCENFFSQNKKGMKNEISEIIKMVKSGVPRDSRRLNLRASHSDNILSAGCSSSQPSNESAVNELENLETQLSDETSYQSSGSPNSVVCNIPSTSKISNSVTFQKAEASFLSKAVSSNLSSSSHRPSLTPLVPSRAISNPGVQSKSNFNSSALSTVATTSDDVSVSKNPLDNNSRSPSRTKDELDKIMNEMNNIVRDLDPTTVSTSDAPALNVSASAVNRLSTAISNNLSVSKHEGLTSL